MILKWNCISSIGSIKIIDRIANIHIGDICIGDIRIGDIRIGDICIGDIWIGCIRIIVGWISRIIIIAR